ncbi:MAG: nucleoside deaminase [Phycisphaeraceae bacterium]|nr:nucleoside deaminase [Phycisphaeraceae bacterium]
MSEDHSHWMRHAIEQARKGIASGQSPFGAVVVRAGALVAGGHNEVWKRTDPTAHAEVVCIQNAAKALASIDLAGCVMYTTTEPCPMCASAIHWSKLDAVYCGATIADAETAGFTELTLPIEEVYRIGKSKTKAIRGVLVAECAHLFSEWKAARGRAY